MRRLIALLLAVAALGAGGTRACAQHATAAQILRALGTIPDVIYFEGSSITRGLGLGTAERPGGGLAGSFADLLCTSNWGSAATCYNDGLDGSTSAAALRRYTTGNSRYGVPVPSAQSVAAKFAGHSKRLVYFLDLSVTFNDANADIDAAGSIANLQRLVAAARKDGWTVVVMSDVVLGRTAKMVEQIATVDQALRNGVIPADQIIDAVTWIPDPANKSFYLDRVHPNSTGHERIAANLLVCLAGAGCPIDYAGPYRANVTVTGTAPDSPPLRVSATLVSGTNTLELFNAMDNEYAQIGFMGTGRRWQFGVGNSGEKTRGVANSIFLYDQTGAKVRLRLDTRGNLAVTGSVTGGDPAELVGSSVPLDNGAGNGLGTLGNAPAAGNPTKWIPINDNGTVRYVPAW